MAPNAKRVFYVEYLSSPLYAQVLAQRPDVQLDRLENEEPATRLRPDPVGGPCLPGRRIAPGDGASTYHVSADAAGPHAEPGRGVVERRRLRPGGRRCLHRARHHRGEPVGRQQGRRRRARAGDDADAVQAHHRDRSAHARRAEHPAQRLYRPRAAEPHGGHHRHRQCRRPPGRAVPRLVQHARAGLRPVSERRAGEGARGREGRAGRPAAPGRFRVDQLPAVAREPLL